MVMRDRLIEARPRLWWLYHQGPRSRKSLLTFHHGRLTHRGRLATFDDLLAKHFIDQQGGEPGSAIGVKV
jgi:hypothetical protein